MTNTTETQNTIKDYYEQLYANKFDNLKKWTSPRHIGTCALSRLDQEEIENYSSLITSNEIKSVIKITINNQRGAQGQPGSLLNLLLNIYRANTKFS
jgi:hypothetical protein